MSRGAAGTSPPVTVPSPSSTSSLSTSRTSNYPINIPTDSASMRRDITYNARPQQPIPGEPGSFSDSPPPRSFSEGFVTSGNGSVRSTSSSHRLRAAAVTASSSLSRQHMQHQMSEPAVPSGSFSRQGSVRGSSYGSESGHYMSPSSVSNRKLSMCEDMQAPAWQSQAVVSGDHHQDAYEDMQPVHQHSRTNSSVSDIGSSFDDSCLSSVSIDSQVSRRAIPDGLQDSTIPLNPGLYTNRLVQENLTTLDDGNYVNVQPIRNQRSRHNKHLEVRDKGRTDREYENVWVVINNPAPQEPNLPSAPRAIPHSGSRRNSRNSCEVNVGSCNNPAVAVTSRSSVTQMSQSPCPSDGLFPMDHSSPHRGPPPVTQQS